MADGALRGLCSEETSASYALRGELGSEFCALTGGWGAGGLGGRGGWGTGGEVLDRFLPLDDDDSLIVTWDCTAATSGRGGFSLRMGDKGTRTREGAGAFPSGRDQPHGSSSWKESEKDMGIGGWGWGGGWEGRGGARGRELALLPQNEGADQDVCGVRLEDLRSHPMQGCSHRRCNNFRGYGADRDGSKGTHWECGREGQHGPAAHCGPLSGPRKVGPPAREAPP